MTTQREARVTQAQHREVLERLDEVARAHALIVHRIAEVEKLITQHMQSEHAAFDSLISIIESSKLGAKIAVRAIGLIIAVLVAIATLYDWIADHTHLFRPMK